MLETFIFIGAVYILAYFSHCDSVDRHIESEKRYQIQCKRDQRRKLAAKEVK